MQKLLQEVLTDKTTRDKDALSLLALNVDNYLPWQD